jgi:YVTN family beta-propeller protein
LTEYFENLEGAMEWPVLKVLGLVCVSFLAPLLVSSETETPPSRGFLLVANKGNQTLGIIDPEAGREVAEVPEGGITGHEVAASPDGQTAYVPIYGNSGVGRPGTDGRTMAVIDLASRRVVRTLDFDKPLRPHCAVVGPKNGLLYVTTELSNSITVIDPKSLRIVSSIPTGQRESHMLAITQDGQRGYTANVGPGTVSAIDLVAKKTLAIIPISPNTQRIALSPDDRWAFTADQSAPRLAVIDTSTNTLKTWVKLPTVAYGTAATPDGRWLLIALPDANKIGVLDIETMKIARTVAVGKMPQEILVRPDGEMAYVSCQAAGKIAAVNLKTWTVDKLIPAGPDADGLAWAPEKP